MEKVINFVPLTKLKKNESACVVEIKTEDTPKIRKLAAFGLMPGSSVRVVQKYPAIIIQSGFTQLALDEDIAAEIMVEG
jgi:Fe2+ transport system protein FeoA